MTRPAIRLLALIALSYDDKLGMRMFSSIGNAPGTCAAQ